MRAKNKANRKKVKPFVTTTKEEKETRKAVKLQTKNVEMTWAQRVPTIKRVEGEEEEGEEGEVDIEAEEIMRQTPTTMTKQTTKNRPMKTS